MDFTFDNTMPELTLEPVLEPTEVAPVQPEPPKVNEPVLTPQEQKIVEDFAAKIDVENTAQILQYGAGTQKKMADFSDAALANVRTQDLGEVGDLIVSVVGELKGFDADEAKGFLGFFRKQADKLDSMKIRQGRDQCGEDRRCVAAASGAAAEGFRCPRSDVQAESGLFQGADHVHSGGQAKNS